MTTITPSGRLVWRPHSDGLALHIERRSSAVLHIVRDQIYSQMWRIRFPDGCLSDMTNLTRCKDAALSQARGILLNEKEAKETSAQAGYRDLQDATATTVANEVTA